MASILPECFEFFLQIILQNTAISHAKRHIFSVCPNFVLSRAPQIPWQKHIPEQLFYRTAPCGCFQMPVIFLKKRKTETILQPPLSLILFRMGFFGAVHGWGGAFLPHPPKIHHTYPTMMKLGTVIPYLRKIKKMYKSRDTFLDSCGHRHFLPEISKFCHIKNYTYRLDFDT